MASTSSTLDVRRVYFLLIMCTVLYAARFLPSERADPAVDSVAVAANRVKIPGYERAAFGTGWLTPPGSGCDMRAIVIAHALATSSNHHKHALALGNDAPPTAPSADNLPATERGADPIPACDLHAGQLYDPYSGQDIDFDPARRAQVEIDHIYPLAAAWDMGAAAWSQEMRQAFANDPLNLIAVSRSNNQAKSDQLPAAWLPPERSNRCWYVGRLAQVALKYGLPLPQDDIRVMKRQCLPF